MRRKGFIGQVISIISLIIWAGLFVALLKRFDWDIIALGSWILNSIWNLISSVADAIGGNDSFRRITS